MVQDKKKKRKRMSVSETESSDGPEDYDVESDWSVACLTEQVPISTYPLVPTYQYLPISTYLSVLTFRYLSISTHLSVPTYHYLPLSTYLSVPPSISRYLPISAHYWIDKERKIDRAQYLNLFAFSLVSDLSNFFADPII